MPGADKQLSREHVVLTAHLDHLGITEPVKDDSINNGSLDNAAGVNFITLNYQIARALADVPERPHWNRGDYFGMLFKASGHDNTGTGYGRYPRNGSVNFTLDPIRRV